MLNIELLVSTCRQATASFCSYGMHRFISVFYRNILMQLVKSFIESDFLHSKILKDYVILSEIAA